LIWNLQKLFYTTPILFHFINKYNLDYKNFVRNETINGEEDVESKKVTELILYKNNFNTKTNTNTLTNNQNYKPLEKAA